jgi:hypothetical protein
MVVRTLLESAMKKIGVIAPRETANVNDLNDCLATLQSMLRLWATKSLLVFATSKDSKVLTPSTASYTWGSGGVITSSRPSSILGAYVSDGSGNDFPVNIISEREYNDISRKATTGRPEYLFFYPAYPLATIYLYPTPDAAYTLNVDSRRPFTETSSFLLLTDTLLFPPSYEEPMIYWLAVRIAPEFGKTVPPEVLMVAEAGYEAIAGVNSSNQVSPIHVNFPAGRSRIGNYDINEG